MLPSTPRRRLVSLAVMSTLLVGPSTGGIAAREPGPLIRIGAVFPVEGSAAPLARQELLGVQLAIDFANADGGIDGRQLVLDVRDLERGQDAPAIMRDLRRSGVSVVIGAYASELSVPASLAADAAGLVYWEAGAVADRLTARGLPRVFRVGASGTNLGISSATFAATALAPALGISTKRLRIAFVAADDPYARSVAAAAEATARASGLPVVASLRYDLVRPEWPVVMERLLAARPDVLILASHIPDGIAFRRAMLQAGLRVGALIGTTMAECSPDFAGELGQDAVGVFASDRPTGGFRPDVLDPAAHALYQRLAAAWAAGERGPAWQRAGTDTWPDAAMGSEYTITGPVLAGSAAAGPTEEGLSGFSAAWVLVHDVLPTAATTGTIDPDTIAAAARAVDLPDGSLPNGAGVRFSSDPATLGQNERASAVIWQWQAVRSYTYVWPPAYATGTLQDVPLPR